jgi:hypothetical protein
MDNAKYVCGINLCRGGFHIRLSQNHAHPFVKHTRSFQHHIHPGIQKMVCMVNINDKYLK